MNQFKILSLTCVCLSLISSSGFSEEVKGEPASVVDAVADEAAVLRALVEEYKAKAAAKANPAAAEAKTDLIQPAKEGVANAAENVAAARAAVLEQMVSQILPPKGDSAAADQPQAPGTPSVESIIPTPEIPVATLAPEAIAGQVEMKKDAAQPAVEAISSVTALISNPIEPVDSVISSTQANMAPGIVINDAALQAPKVSEIPKVEAPTVPMPAAPTGTIVLNDDAPDSGSESLEAAAAAAAASALEPGDAPAPVGPEMAAVVTAPIPTAAPAAPAVPVVAAAAPATPVVPSAAPAAPAPVAPAAANSVEMAVAETLKELEAGKSTAKEKVAALEGSAMKEAEKPAAAVEKALDETPKVAKADEMKKAVDATKPKTSTKSGSEKPLAMAKKKTTPAAGTAPAETRASVVTQSGETLASATTPAAGSTPTAPKTNTLKDLGKRLFGPRSGAQNSNSSPRAPIFKRKAQPEAQPAATTSSTSTTTTSSR